MKFNESWLREWVDPKVSTAQLCDQITMLGLEVDSVEPISGEFSGVVVAEVVECTQHPDADKLRVTKVNVGAERLLSIVCGAANCRQGLKVACAIEGAILPGNFKIKKTKLRGQLSEGMLCSFSELGIKEDQSSGIIELPADAPIGVDIREYLNLNDVAIEVSLTPNRADCLSIAGIAREVAVINQMEVKSPVIKPVPATLSAPIQIDIQAPSACPHYLARIIKNVNVNATSPLWLQEKLRRCGIRSIDPIVDITNLSLLELGQPMHAFDAEKVKAPIQVRLAKDQEQLVLLDGTTAKLQTNTLVIADQKNVLALAGIMGGEASKVNAETKDIILEAAFFAPLALTGRTRQYGLHTDASHRFERGVDPTLARQAMERATTLIIEICGGEVAEVCEAINTEYLPKQPIIRLRRTKLDSVIGHYIEDRLVTDILVRLGLNVTCENDGWIATVPSWRFDLEIEEDLIEEIARIYGYNRIPNNALLAHLTLKGSAEKVLEPNRIKTVLVDNDYQEVVTYSFVDPKIQQLLHPQQEALILPNPISSEMSAMRVSLLTGLLQTVLYNQNRQQNRIRIFEQGLRFIPDASAESAVRQEAVFAAVIVGEKHIANWEGKSKAVDFFDLKGDLEQILALTANKELTFVAKQFPALHPGQSAAIMLNEQEVGFIGTLHPSIGQKLGIKGTPIVFELLADVVSERAIPVAKEISKFPANNRDIAIVIDEHIPAREVLSACYHAGREQLTAVNLFDVYQGANLVVGKKSLAISLTIQNTEKTLTEEEISAVIQLVLDELAQRFQASLRD